MLFSLFKIQTREYNLMDCAFYDLLFIKRID